jgi:hypothetical protein
MVANLVADSAGYPGERAELVDARRGFTCGRLRIALAVMWDFIWIKKYSPNKRMKNI